ncbi:MAG: potassium channel family protein [Euryarchaeota archaeon]|nr:potassium channel family protein [Euryarchaeota archaeon]
MYKYLNITIIQTLTSLWLKPKGFYALHITFSDFIYFSFVTLTTTGFGDITPLSGLARSLTILETVTGVLFVAVLMARLVGMLGQGGKTESDQD